MKSINFATYYIFKFITYNKVIYNEKRNHIILCIHNDLYSIISMFI